MRSEQDVVPVHVTGGALRDLYSAIRAVRMALLTPAFTPDAETRAEIEAHGQVLASADAGDVGYEINSILKSSEYSRGITLLSEVGLLQQVFTSFLPFAADADVDDATRLFSVLDDVMTPCQELVSRHLPVMRLAILLTTAMRRSGLNVAGDEGRRFLVREGDRLEQAFNDLYARFCPRGIQAFRIRMITIGYWRGLASLAEETTSIEVAIESSMNIFGRHKGLLSGLLIGADWLLHGRADPNASRQADRVRDAVQRLTARHEHQETRP